MCPILSTNQTEATNDGWPGSDHQTRAPKLSESTHYYAILLDNSQSMGSEDGEFLKRAVEEVKQTAAKKLEQSKGDPSAKVEVYVFNATLSKKFSLKTEEDLRNVTVSVAKEDTNLSTSLEGVFKEMNVAPSTGRVIKRMFRRSTGNPVVTDMTIVSRFQLQDKDIKSSCEQLVKNTQKSELVLPRKGGSKHLSLQDLKTTSSRRKHDHREVASSEI